MMTSPISARRRHALSEWVERGPEMLRSDDTRLDNDALLWGYTAELLAFISSNI